MHSFFTGIEFMMRGGLMMYPMLLSVLVALAVIFERLYILQKVYATDSKQVSEVFQLIQSKKISQARFQCSGKNTPLWDVLSTGLAHFENPVEEMELSMRNQAEAWVPLLERRIEILDTVITAAPLMGLLGTITGMMASFQILSEKGVNEPHAITGGVAEALIATATGLVIALICLLAYNYFNSKIKSYIYSMESAASRLVELRISTQRNEK